MIGVMFSTKSRLYCAVRTVSNTSINGLELSHCRLLILAEFHSRTPHLVEVTSVTIW